MENRPYPMVRTAVFVYDCSRFLFLLALLTAHLGPAGMFQGSNNLPHMMYAASQALFPLMSFFLLIRFDFSRAYMPLYITGKILCLLCILLWILFTFQRIREIPRFVTWSFFIGAADFGTITGMVLLQQAYSASGGSYSQPEETQDGGE
jgi:hypothetical protein